MIDPSTQNHIAQVAHDHEAELLAKKNVVGIGVSLKQRGGIYTEAPCLTAYVTEKKSVSPIDRVDAFVDGVPTDVVAIGTLAPLTQRIPFRIGDEVGVVAGGRTGTLGLIFRGRLNDNIHKGFYDLALTNAHVVWGQRRGTFSFRVGEKVASPYAWEAQEAFGEVARVRDPKAHNVDAALLRIDWGGDPPAGAVGYHARGWDVRIDQLVTSGFMASYGGAPLVGFPHYHTHFNALIRSDKDATGYRATPAGLGTVQVGERVWKAGARTGITYGTVYATNLIAVIPYEDPIGALVVRDKILVITEPGLDMPYFVRNGDSGSCVIDPHNNVVGMAFAGSELPEYRYGTGIIDPIQDVFQALFLPDELEPYNLNREA